MRVADYLEKLYKTNQYDLRYPLSYRISFILHTFKNRLGVFSYQHQTLFKPLSFIFRHHWKNLDEEIAYLKQGYQRNVATEEEIQGLSERIRAILANG